MEAEGRNQSDSVEKLEAAIGDLIHVFGWERAGIVTLVDDAIDRHNPPNDGDDEDEERERDVDEYGI